MIVQAVWLSSLSVPGLDSAKFVFIMYLGTTVRLIFIKIFWEDKLNSLSVTAESNPKICIAGKIPVGQPIASAVLSNFSDA